ncbi:hypothetical protein [Mammaliicoccus sciuri]|uniref:hypothetical protein n=1 Tax=Mammaliicoccus sciuri TaxID=1296 RepID=UPI0021D12FFF|nr:hypothetical protein [Mammaliicoccus sciuri]UXU70139.1 hypothetical protein MUA36_05520 [Mammaliicoccus sciuri]
MELTKQQIEQVRELFSEYAKKQYLDSESNDKSEYSYHVYTDYHTVDYIKEYTLTNAQLSRQEILDKLYEDFYTSDMDYYHFDDFKNDFKVELENIKTGLSVDFNQYNFEYEIIILSGHIDYEQIVDDIKLPVNIVLEDKESFDMEFSNNNFYNIFYNVDYNNKEDIEELIEELKESSLNILLNKQGYKLKQFVEYLKDNHNNKKNILDNDKVFQSIVQEIDNAYNYVALTVCRNMTFKELEELKQSNTITINTNDVIGYHGYVDGSGSNFEIELRTDMKYKVEDINIHIDCAYGYGLSEVYGNHLAS